MNGIIKKILIGFIIFILVIAFSEAIFKTSGHILSWLGEKKDSTYTNGGKNMSEEGIDEGSVQDSLSVGGEQELDANSLYMYVNDFLRLVNDGKIQEAYGLLAQEYRDMFYPDFEKFAEYCRKNLTAPKGKTGEILYFDKFDRYTYLCKVRISEFEPVGDAPPSQIEYFTIYAKGSEPTFAFDGFISSKPVDMSVETGNIRLNVTNITRYHNRMKLNLVVVNGESQPVSILDANSEDVIQNITVASEDKIMQYIDALDFYSALTGCNCFSVEPNSQGEFVLEFIVPGNRKLFKINFGNILVGQEVRTAELLIE